MVAQRQQFGETRHAHAPRAFVALARPIRMIMIIDVTALYGLVAALASLLARSTIACLVGTDHELKFRHCQKALVCPSLQRRELAEDHIVVLAWQLVCEEAFIAAQNPLVEQFGHLRLAFLASS